MKLAKIGVGRPTATIIFFLAITLMGLVSIGFLNLDLMPKLELPMVTVFTPYPGASPKDVEKNITKVMEEQLSVVSGVDTITSKSEENISIITISFGWETSISDGANDVRDKLGLAKRMLPDDAEEPFLFKMDLSMMPVLMFSIQCSPERFPTLRQYAEDNIINPLKKLPGVAQAQLIGGIKRQIRVELDRKRLEAVGVSYDAVKGVVAASNVTIPGGNTTVNDTTFLLRVPGEIHTPETLNNLVVGMNPQTGAVVYLKDVATIKDTTGEQTYFAEGPTGPSLMVMVQKQSSANTVKVAKRVLKTIEKLKKDLPKDVKISIIRDFSLAIQRTISNLASVVTSGGIFVILVILLFLRNLRGGIIMAITIPTSLIVTFLFMYIKGYTINMISLTSISIAIGMVVDNGIVVLENIFQHLDRGSRPREAAIEGTSEVGGAIMASTLTTVVIFFPVVYLGGIVGVLFTQLAFMITIALIASLVVALMLVPTLSSVMLSNTKPKGVFRWLYDKSEYLFKAVESGYVWLLKVALHNKLLAFSLIAGVSLSSVLLIPHVGTEFMPQQDNGFLQAKIELPPGTKKEITAKYARELSARLHKAIPEIKTMMTSWGKSADSAIGASFGGNQQGDNYATIFISLISKKHRTRSNKEIADAMQHLTTIFPGAKVIITAEDQMQSMIFGGGKPISVEIYGENEHIAANLATEVAQKLKRIPGISEVEISRKEGVPEMTVVVDREKSSMMGVNMYSIGNTVRTAFNGITISRYREAGKEYDIFLRLREADRNDLQKLLGLKIPTVAGSYVTLGNLASLKQAQGPVSIERKNQQRIIKVEAGVMGRDMGSVSEDVETMIKTIKTPPGMSIQLGGARQEQNESFQLLLLAMILGVFLVYFVMAAQFESLRDPFIILFTIPFAMVGALWAFVISGQTLSLLSFVGLIMLVGIVVNNGIVLVDFINILRARGKGVLEAVLEGGQSRLRPVLMTTITTITGMIPLSQSTGEGSEMWVAMATVVIGGLIVSTFITLFFVPIMYTFLELGHQRRMDRKKKRAHKKRLRELKTASEEN